MRYPDRFRVSLKPLSKAPFGALLFALALVGCHPQPVMEPPEASPTPSAKITVEDIKPDAPPVNDITVDLNFPPAIPSPTVAEADKPTIVLPPPPPMPAAATQFLLSTGGHALILDFETGGKADYNQHPEWPGGSSGVTIGIGYDLGYYSKSVIDADWHGLQTIARTRLLAVSGANGARARTLAATVRDIIIGWQLATEVFDNVDVAREFANCKHSMPGCEDLRPNAQAAIISLGFNRGWGLSGPNRLEMRNIRDLVPKRDYEGMAIQFRKMVRVWRGTDIEKGMTRRRLAEAELMETP